MLIPGFTAGAQAPAELHTRWSPWRALLGALAPQQRTRTEKAVTDRTELEAQVAALHRVQAVIEFALDGTILQANDNFLQVMGYRLEEIQGRHHSLFVLKRLVISTHIKMLVENFFEPEIMCQLCSFFKLGRIYVKNSIVYTFTLAFDFFEYFHYSKQVINNM